MLSSSLKSSLLIMGNMGGSPVVLLIIFFPLQVSHVLKHDVMFGVGITPVPLQIGHF